jgi:hypothetical protein
VSDRSIGRDSPLLGACCQSWRLGAESFRLFGRERRRRPTCDARPADNETLLPPRQQVVPTRCASSAKLAGSGYNMRVGRVSCSPSDAAGTTSLGDPLAVAPRLLLEQHGSELAESVGTLDQDFELRPGSRREAAGRRHRGPRSSTKRSWMLGRSTPVLSREAENPICRGLLALYGP